MTQRLIQYLVIIWWRQRVIIQITKFSIFAHFHLVAPPCGDQMLNQALFYVALQLFFKIKLFTRFNLVVWWC